MESLKNKIFLLGILIIIGVLLSVMATVVMRNNLKDGSDTKITLQNINSENENGSFFSDKDEGGYTQQYLNVRIEQKGKLIENVSVPLDNVGNRSR